MINEGLIKQDLSGKYCLVFFNRNDLPEDELHEIFSQFGNVSSIKGSFGIHSFHFVRYESLDEIHKAIVGLENHESIRLEEHKPKNPQKYKEDLKKEVGNIYNNSNSKNNNSGMNGNYNRGRGQGRGRGHYQNNHRNYNKFDNGFPNDYSDRYVPCTTFPKRYRILDPEILLKKPSSNDNSLECAESSMDKTFTDSAYSSPNTLCNTKSASVEFTDNNLDKTDSSSLTSSLSKKSSRSVISSDEIPDLVRKNSTSKQFKVKRDSWSGEDIPELMNPVGQVRNSAVGKHVIIREAEEIIVANVHSNFGPAYLLHLFHQFEPLAVSNAYFLPDSEYYYCHVYFKSKKDSLEVEKRFDQQVLFGKKLLVLGTGSLVKTII